MIYLSRWMLQTMLNYPTWLKVLDVVITIYVVWSLIDMIVKSQKGEF